MCTFVAAILFALICPNKTSGCRHDLAIIRVRVEFITRYYGGFDTARGQALRFRGHYSPAS